MYFQSNLSIAWDWTSGYPHREQRESKSKSISNPEQLPNVTPKTANNATSSRRLVATTHREASDADAESFPTGREDYSEVVKAIKTLHHHILYQRWLYRSILESGRTLLPSTMRIRNLCNSGLEDNDPDIATSRSSWSSGLEHFVIYVLLRRQERFETDESWVVGSSAKKGATGKGLQCCLSSEGFIHNMCAIQGHSGGNKVEQSLVDNVEIPCMWIGYCYHAGGKDTDKGRQTVFFTAVDFMADVQEEKYHDVTEPQRVQNKT